MPPVTTATPCPLNRPELEDASDSVAVDVVEVVVVGAAATPLSVGSVALHAILALELEAGALMHTGAMRGETRPVAAFDDFNRSIVHVRIKIQDGRSV